MGAHARTRGSPYPAMACAVSLLATGAAAFGDAYIDPYVPVCATTPPAKLTLQGAAVGGWEDDSWLATHAGAQAVGAMYANVPAMSLQPGDKLAFDTSVLGSEAVNVTLSLSTCVPTTTIPGDNAEHGLTYTCEETLRPDETVRPRPPRAYPRDASSRLTRPRLGCVSAVRRVRGPSCRHEGARHAP